MGHNGVMVRPCFLVVDREHSNSISTRKLVIETAKFNVITAYSSEEATATLQRFPNVDAVVLDAGIRDMPCSYLVKALKEIKPGVPVIAVGTPRAPECAGADHFLDSFNPASLLDKLKSMKPEQTEAIGRTDAALGEAAE